MKQSRLVYLFERYMDGTCTKREKQQYFDYMMEYGNEEIVKLTVERIPEGELKNEAIQLIPLRIWKGVGKLPRSFKFFRWWDRMAAAVVRR
jgi:hypothetical protein